MLQNLKRYIFKELVFVDNADEFTETDDLLDAGLDSMGIMRLVLYIEEAFGVSLPDDELVPENLRTLKSLEDWVNRHT
ncbi:MAG: acyl carrier protein [Gammaproteobacteria bacterium]